MRASGWGNKRALLSVGGVAVTLAASLALAEAAPAAAPLPADRGAGLPLLSPEAAPSLGEVGDESPLVAVFNAARVGGDGAPSLTLFASPKLDFTSVGDIAPVGDPAHADRPQGQANETAGPAAEETGRAPFAPAQVGALPEGPSAQDNPPPGFAAAPIAAPLSPLQSALETAMERARRSSQSAEPARRGRLARRARRDCGLLRRARLCAGVGRRGRPDRGRARRPLATGTRGRRRPRSLAIRAPARHRTRPRRGRPRRGRDDHRLGRGDLRRTGDRVARRAIAPLAVA